MSRYVLTLDAARDLVDIRNYIELQSRAEIADRVVAEIRARIELLCTSPGVGHSITEDGLRFAGNFISAVARGGDAAQRTTKQ